MQVIDLRSGDAVHWLRFAGITSSTTSSPRPGVRRTMALGFETDDIRRVLSTAE